MRRSRLDRMFGSVSALLCWLVLATCGSAAFAQAQAQAQPPLPAGVTRVTEVEGRLADAQTERDEAVALSRMEIDQARPGLIACDVALNTQRVGYQVLAEPQPVQLRFRNDHDHAQFEFRLFPVEEEATPDFRFYGGRLSKRGAASGLHQSEYLILLIELIALRLGRTGLLIDTADSVGGA